MSSFNQLKSSFTDQKLLTLALTHRSWINEHAKSYGTNERLEFLGDAVLEFVVSKKLFAMFPAKEEGYLTALRSNLVNTVNLADMAKILSLGNNLLLSKGEEDGGGRENPSLLADTFEAVIGAIFLDQGLKSVESFLEKSLFLQIEEKIKHPLKDAKSRLQEMIQANSEPAPRYNVVNESGPDHNKIFIVEVLVNQKAIAQGSGKSKAEAQQAAAEEALKKLQK